MARLSQYKPFHFKWRAALWVIKSSQCVSIWSSLQSYQWGYIILLNWEQLPEMESKGFSSLQCCDSSCIIPHLHKSLYIYLLSSILLASNTKMSMDLWKLLRDRDTVTLPCWYASLIFFSDSDFVSGHKDRNMTTKTNSHFIRRRYCKQHFFLHYNVFCDYFWWNEKGKNCFL